MSVHVVAADHVDQWWLQPDGRRVVGDRPGGQWGLAGPLGQMLHRFPPRSHVVMTTMYRQQSDISGI